MNEINWVTTLVHILLFLWREGQKCKCISFVYSFESHNCPGVICTLDSHHYITQTSVRDGQTRPIQCTLNEE